MAGSPWEEISNSPLGRAATGAVEAAASSPLNPWAHIQNARNMAEQGIEAVERTAAQPPPPPRQNRVKPTNLLQTPAEREAELFRDNPIVDVEAGHRLRYNAARWMKQALDEIRGMGKDFGIQSSTRTREEQEYLYNTLPPGMAAAPGTSHHEAGYAVDTWGYDDPEVVSTLEKYGFTQSVGHEPWHFTWQPGIPAGSGERKWADDDPRMQRFREGDNFTGSPRHMAQSIAASQGYSSTDQSILLRLWDQESGFDHTAVSGAGAMGIGQIMPANLPALLAESGATLEDYKQSPQLQVQLSLKMIDGLLRQYDGNWAKALAAYNGGGGAVDYAEEKGYFPSSTDPNSWYAQTLPYVAGILGVDNGVAMQMISGATESPRAKLPDPSQEKLEVQQGLKNGMSEWIETIFGGADPELEQAQALLADTGGVTSDVGMVGTVAEPEVVPFLGGKVRTRDREATQDMEKQISWQVQNVQEGFKMMASGFLTGAFMPYEMDKMLADPTRNPAGVFGAAAQYTNPLHMPMAAMDVATGALEKASGRDLPDLGDWTKLMDSLAPSGWWKDRMDENKEARGGEAGMEWVMNRMPWIPFMGTGKKFWAPDSLSGKAWAANMSDFFLHIPYLAGMEMSAQLLGPSQGLLSANKTPRAVTAVEQKYPFSPNAAASKIVTPGAAAGEAPTIAYSGINRVLGAPGELSANLLQKVAPGLVEKLGKPFFQEAAIWGGVGGMQTASESMARNLAKGGDYYSAIGEAMAGFFPGWIAGTALGLGLPGVISGTLKGAKGAATGTAAAAVKVGLPEAFDNFFQAATHGAYPGREMMTRSFADMVRQMDTTAQKAGLGSPSARIMKSVIDWAKSQQRIDRGTLVRRTAQRTRDIAERHRATADEMDTILGQRIQDLQLAEQTAQKADSAIQLAEQNSPMLPSAVGHVQQLTQEMEIWGKAKAEHLNISKVPQAEQGPAYQSWLLTYGQSLGVKDAGEFHSAFAKRQAELRKQYAELPNQFDGVDIAQVKTYMELTEAAGKAKSNLELIQNDPMMKEGPAIQEVSQTFRDMATYLESKAEAIERGLSPAQSRVIQLRDSQGQVLLRREGADSLQPRGWAEVDPAILEAFDESVNLTIRSGLGSLDPIRNPLAFESTRMVRALTETAESGNLPARLNNMKLSLGLQIEALKAQLQVPVTAGRPKPPPKSGVDARGEKFGAEDLKDVNYFEEIGEQAIRAEAWDRDVRPGLEAKRAQDQKRLAELESQLENVNKTISHYEMPAADPNLPRQRVIEKGAEKLNAGLDERARRAGFESVQQVREMQNPPVIKTEKLAARVSKELRMTQPRKPVYSGPTGKGGRPARNSPQWKAYKKSLEQWREHQQTIKDIVDTIRNDSQEWVHAKVPAAWIGQDIADQLPVVGPYTQRTTKPGDPVKEKNRYPAAVMTEVDGQLIVLSGGIPRRGKDRGFVRMYMPRDLWEGTLVGAMPASVKSLLVGDPVRVRLPVGEAGPVPNTLPRDVQEYWTANADNAPVLADELLSAAQAFPINRPFLSAGVAGSPYSGVGDLMDVALTVVGKKPAALVDHSTIHGKRGFMMQEILQRAKDVGLEIRTTPDGRNTVVGEAASVQHVMDNLGKNPIEVGRGLGYPEVAIQHFMNNPKVMGGVMPEGSYTPVRPASTFTLHDPQTGKPLLKKYDPLEASRQWLEAQHPNKQAAMIVDEFLAISQEVAAGDIPSLQALRQLQAIWNEARGGMKRDAAGAPSMDEVPAIPGTDVVDQPAIHTVGDLARILAGDETLRQAWADDLGYRPPASVTDVAARATQAHETWAYRRATAEATGDKIALDYDRQIREILKKDPRFKGLKDTDPIPKEVRERFVDAMEAMGSDPSKMQALLREMPELRNAYGAYFQILEMAEKWQAGADDMADLFRDYWFRHMYPDLNDIMKAVDMDDGSSKLPGGRLLSEMSRKIPTLSEARKLGTEAYRQVGSGDWTNISRAPSTPEGRVKRFLDLPVEKRAQVLGLALEPDGTVGPKALEQVRRTTLHLGLKNPLDDPAKVLGGHIKALLHARATRDWLRDMSLVSIPGAPINPHTGRPYSVLERFEKPQDVPAVPRLARPGDAGPVETKLVALSSDSIGLHPHSKVRIGGEEVPAGQLYIWEDAADLYNQYIRQGGQAKSLPENLDNTLHLLRTAALFGKPVVYGSIMLGSVWGELHKHGMQTFVNAFRRPIKNLSDAGRSIREAGQGAQLVARAPIEAVGMLSAGNKLGTDPALYAHWRRLGLNIDPGDASMKSLVKQMQKYLEAEGFNSAPEPNPGTGTSALRFANDEMQFSVLDRYATPLGNRAGPPPPRISMDTPEQPGGQPGFSPNPKITADMAEGNFQAMEAAGASFKNDWNRMRDNHQHLGPLLDRLGKPTMEKVVKLLAAGAAAGKNLDLLMNNYLVFESAKNAMVASAMHWSTVFMKEHGQRMIAAGMPEHVVQDLIQRSAADYVNKQFGALPWLKDTVGANQAGRTFTLTPGILRTKVHHAAELMDEMVEKNLQIPNGMPRGEFAGVEPSLRQYRRNMAWSGLGYTFGALYLGMQAMSWAVNGRLASDHPDPNMRMKWQIGDRAMNALPFPLNNVVNPGIRKDLWKAADAIQSGDPTRMVRLVTGNAHPLVWLIADLERNAVPGAGTAFSPDATWDSGAKLEQGGQIMELMARRLMGGLLESTGSTGMYDKDTPKLWDGPRGQAFYLLEQMGYNAGSPYPGYAGFRAKVEGLEQEYSNEFRKNAEPYLKRYYVDGDESALETFDMLARRGVPTKGTGKEIFGPIWYPSEKSLESMRLKLEDPKEAALAGLPKLEGRSLLGMGEMDLKIKGLGLGGKQASDQAMAKRRYLEQVFKDYEDYRWAKAFENLMMLRSPLNDKDPRTRFETSTGGKNTPPPTTRR